MTRHNTNDREKVLDQAVRAGKILASTRSEYARMYDANPAAIHKLLTARVEDGGLMPGLRGSGEDPATAAPGGYDESWLSPIERERIASAGGPSPAPSTPPAPAPSPAPAVPLGEVGVSAEVPASPPRPQPQQASSAPAAGGSGDEYPAGWLSADERDRISAAREGRYTPGAVQFDEGVRPR